VLTWSSLTGPTFKAVAAARMRYTQRRRVRVVAHKALFFDGYGASPLTANPDASSPLAATTGSGGAYGFDLTMASPPVTGFGGKGGISEYYFLKITNRSLTRPIEVTHAWFDLAPGERLMSTRSLPRRLEPEQTWEGWVNAANFTQPSKKVFRSGRAQLSSGKVVAAHRNRKVPQIGEVSTS